MMLDKVFYGVLRDVGVCWYMRSLKRIHILSQLSHSFFPPTEHIQGSNRDSSRGGQGR